MHTAKLITDIKNQKFIIAETEYISSIRQFWQEQFMWYELEINNRWIMRIDKIANKCS